MTQQQHHPDQVHNAHHRASQIIGHVEDLQGTRGSRLDGSSPNNQPSIIRRSIGVKSLADVTGKAASAQLGSVTVREQSQLKKKNRLKTKIQNSKHSTLLPFDFTFNLH